MASSIELGQSFQTPSMEAWRDLARQTLRGADPDSKLKKRGVQGIDLAAIYSDGPDGVALGRSGGWQVRQEVRCSSLKQASKQARTDLALGGDAVWLRVDRSTRLGVRPDRVRADGALCLMVLDDLAAVLRYVDLAKVPVCIEAGANGLSLFAAVIALAHRQGVQMHEVRGSVQGDPLACLVRDGQLPRGIDAAYDDLAACSLFALERCPDVRVLGLSTVPLHEAGSEAVDELAYLLGAMAETLRRLTARGLSVEQIARSVEVTMAVGSDLFVELGKLRAARRLWSKLLGACGTSDVGLQLHARASNAAMTRRDPWVNMLRSTQAGFVAAVGGADAVTLLPFDAALGESDKHARRVVRNLHLLLAEEGHLAQVADPGAGSYYLEHLTDQLARGAWERFQQMEQAGGVLQCLSDGTLQDDVDAASERRASLVATRRQGIVGVSKFANKSEVALTRAQFDAKSFQRKAQSRWQAASMVGRAPSQAAALRVALDALSSGTLDRVQAAANALALGASFADVAGDVTVPFAVRPMQPVRVAAGWESLRDRGQKTGMTVFFANLGPVSQHKGREAFAADLFVAAGLSIKSDGVLRTVDELVEAFEASGASAVCICGADPSYQVVPELSVALRGAGARCVIVAGRRPAEPQWPSVDEVVHMGADVLAVLTRVCDVVGGAS